MREEMKVEPLTDLTWLPPSIRHAAAASNASKRSKRQPGPGALHTRSLLGATCDWPDWPLEVEPLGTAANEAPGSSRLGRCGGFTSVECARFGRPCHCGTAQALLSMLALGFDLIKGAASSSFPHPTSASTTTLLSSHQTLECPNLFGLDTVPYYSVPYCTTTTGADRPTGLPANTTRTSQT